MTPTTPSSTSNGNRSTIARQPNSPGAGRPSFSQNIWGDTRVVLTKSRETVLRGNCGLYRRMPQPVSRLWSVACAVADAVPPGAGAGHQSVIAVHDLHRLAPS